MSNSSDDRKPDFSAQIADADSRKPASALPSRATLQRPSTSSTQTASVNPSHPKKSRMTPKRTHQVMTRFNQKEYTLFLKRLERSGQPQGEYLRTMALTGQINVVDQSELLIAVLDMLADIQTDLGKQNGMLKMIIRPNEGQRQLAPTEWEILINFLRQNEESVRRITDIKEIINGNR